MLSSIDLILIDSASSGTLGHVPQTSKARLEGCTSSVALKPLYNHAEAAESTKTQAIAARRVQSLSASNNPRIVAPVGLTTVNGVLHIVSPWYERGNLRQNLQNWDIHSRIRIVSFFFPKAPFPLHPDLILSQLKEVADALGALHILGRVHSSLKLVRLFRPC